MIIHKTDDDKDHPFLLACDMSELEALYDLISWFTMLPRDHEWNDLNLLIHIKFKLAQVTGERK